MPDNLPYSASTYHKRGLVYNNRKEWRKAIEAYTHALELGHPNPHLIYFLRAGAQLEIGELSAMNSDFAESIRLNPLDPLVFFGRGIADIRQKDYKAAIADFTEAIRLDKRQADPRQADAYFWRGRAYRWSGNSEKALADFSQSILLNPAQKTEIYAERAQIYQLLHDQENAIPDFDKALQISPNNAYLHYMRGLSHVIESHFELAVEDLTKAIEYGYGQPAPVYATRGRIYMILGELDASLSDYDEAIRLDPHKPRSYNNRGFTYLLKNDFQSANRDFSQAITLDPQYFYSYTSRGEMYFVQGELEEALSNFEQAYALNSNFPFVLAGLAVAHHALRHYAEARSFWQRLITTHPGFENPDKLRSEFQSSDAFLEEARKVAAL